ncbi:pyruvate dehydrogenase (acetyl-transferring) E1 component subunit alpha [Priestia filamentosa]|uniref:Pyruvate dehydrogenase E1 component subunit alpha n=1 Tax=Priestia filamentosa TaxID=1402861 RepID=A0A1X7GBN8_9BACI|nr:pyruvate dehydrogenase (acetyl-transferring) E1 component subunit alpha [Priestia filamentosa]AKO90843.1 pyruvate dehydrogenase (acetyl-transferring) E1 component subunit alpha [Priestia filamentosa]AVD54193.1 pyruvate dehydrogenase (acetyl-transferring) E1 component subunit alpha [Priestia filamentosa]MDT3765964.1 pyruvate dehydrogenase (acetyl-transferring) E1 component subunit alpha [Priestia filamentosa]OXS65546.1 pyruvate dehydrogenase (acetyl-transferring) E1 component subunit alpha [P
MKLEFPIFQIINEEGQLTDEKYKERMTEDLVKKFYYNMVRIRTFDRKAISLQRQGRLGTYAPFEGQEASQVGSALALEKDDWVFPTYRDHGATLTFGANMARTYLYWNGRVEGCVPEAGKKIFPPAVPIATQLPHAAGAAMAEQKKGTKNAAIAYFGDGATSEGDFHEGLNFASVFQAPVIFFNQNNGFAISVPIEKQMNSKTIAQKAIAYDMPSIRVDGNDVFAVYFQTMEGLDRARNGGGPTLIEAITWRYGAHTTADDPTKYRNQSDSDRIREIQDPLLRVERYMKKNNLWDEEWVAKIMGEVTNEVEQAIKEMEAFPKPNVNDLFDYVFEKPVWPITKQKEQYFQLNGRED